MEYESPDPWEDNDILHLLDQLDETTAAYVGFSLFDIVVALILLGALLWLINYIFPNSLVKECASKISALPETKKVIENKRQVDATLSTKRPETEIREQMNDEPPVEQETPQSQPLQQDTSWIGELTEEQLSGYTAGKKSSRLLVAVEDMIFDVTERKDLYGEGKPYEKFAGRHVSKALAKWSVAERDLTGDARNLSALEQRRLRHWKTTFENKYTKVGSVKPAG